MITKQEINDLFLYKDGCLYWKKSGTGRNFGKEAGYINSHGYRCIFLNKKLIKTHRLIYILHYGDIPNNFTIDHIDKNRANNKIENLRIATYQENNRNKNSKGFSWSKRHKKWRAKIYINKKCISLGYFETVIDARAMYLKARKIYFKEFA